MRNHKTLDSEIRYALADGRARTRTEIAKRAGISAGHLSNLTSGRIRTISDDAAARLGKSLRVTPDNVKRLLAGTVRASSCVT